MLLYLVRRVLSSILVQSLYDHSYSLFYYVDKTLRDHKHSACKQMSPGGRLEWEEDESMALSIHLVA